MLKIVLRVTLALTSAAIFWVYARSAHEYVQGGVAYLIGQVVGWAFLAALVLWFAAKSLQKIDRLFVAILIGVLAMVFHNRDELKLSTEFRLALQTLGTIKSADEFNRFVEEHPDNRAARAINITLSSGVTARKKILELVAEPPELGGLPGPIYTLPPDNSRRIVRALQKAEENLTTAITAIDTVYDREMASNREQLKSLGSDSFVDGLLEGTLQRHSREKLFMKRSLEARRMLYTAMAAQGEFLLEQHGEFDKVTKRVVFRDQGAVEQWNALAKDVQAAVSALDVVDREGVKLEQEMYDQLKVLTKM